MNMKNILAIAAAAIVGLVSLYYFSVWFAASDAGVKVAVLAGVFSVLSVLVARYFEQQRDIDQRTREKKVKIYEEFYGVVFKMTASQRDKSQAISEKDLQNFFYRFNRDLMLWGSDDVFNSWLRYRSQYDAISSQTTKKDLKDTISPVMSILLAMRRDMGYKWTTVTERDMAATFINDIDEHWPK